MDIMPKQLFSALAHDTRLRCLTMLIHHEELCVCELTHAIGAAQPHISHHVGQLRELGVLLDRREGLWVYYRINRSLPDWVQNVLQDTATGLEHTSPFVDDERALTSMPNAPGAPRCA